MTHQKINVAIVDDSGLTIQIIRKVLLKVIAESNVNIKTYIDGEQFIEAAKFNEIKYDLVITDYMMPKKNGLEVIKFIKRKGSKLRKTTVIVVSSNKSREIVTSCLRAGASNFLHKPFNPSVVEVKIKEALINILKVQNSLEEKEKEIELTTRDEINIELLMHKLRMFLVEYSENMAIEQEEMNDISKFLDDLPLYIEKDEEFMIDFFGAGNDLFLERTLLKEGGPEDVEEDEEDLEETFIEEESARDSREEMLLQIMEKHRKNKNKGR